MQIWPIHSRNKPRSLCHLKFRLAGDEFWFQIEIYYDVNMLLAMNTFQLYKYKKSRDCGNKGRLNRRGGQLQSNIYIMPMDLKVKRRFSGGSAEFAD